MVKNRKFDEEFKREAVKHVRSSGKTASEVARNLGIDVKNLYNWIHQSKDNGILTEEGKELYRLKKELADIKMERDILKKAVAIFSKQQ
jgi:transposase